MAEVMVEKQLKQSGAKINFPEEESMLKQWENMHRPPGPDHVISPSGPGQAMPTYKAVGRWRDSGRVWTAAIRGSSGEDPGPSHL